MSPAPPFRTQAGFLASFRVRHFCSSPSHKFPVLVLRPQGAVAQRVPVRWLLESLAREKSNFASCSGNQRKKLVKTR
jgi:hypothetical protein